jgi:hypothetical protein
VLQFVFVGLLGLEELVMVVSASKFISAIYRVSLVIRVLKVIRAIRVIRTHDGH